MTTTGDSRTQIVEVGGEGDLVVVGADEVPLHGDQSPAEWIKDNLFSTVLNSILTIVFGAIGLILGFLALRFVFVTARWEPVRANLELFMIGQFPRSERPRIIVQMLIMTSGIGLVAGYARQRAIREAELANIEREETKPRRLAASYWALGLFIVASLIVGARTFDPWLVLGGCVLGGMAGFAATLRLANPALKLVLLTPLVLVVGVLTRVQDLDNGLAYGIGVAAVLLLIVVHVMHRPAVTLSAGLFVLTAAFQVLSGTHGLAWVFTTAALMPVVLDTFGRFEDDLPPVLGWIGSVVLAGAGVLLAGLNGFGLIPLAVVLAAASGLLSASRGDASPGRRLGTFALLGVITWQLGRLVDIDGLEWDQWGGLHLNLVVAAASIILAFPIGLLLALGRRSSLPVLRLLSTIYIEIIRGVPLITLLFVADLFLGFFLAGGGTSLPDVTRAVAVITMFSAGYIAEIVRGGLQSVDTGQTEAGQAMGMSPAAITRLLVLPQALRAVIPAMVGQFISLFKDTSLLTFIAVLEFLGVREVVFAQEEFRGFGIAETLVFVAFGFWAVSFTMSRESQRLERRLGIGTR